MKGHLGPAPALAAALLAASACSQEATPAAPADVRQEDAKSASAPGPSAQAAAPTEPNPPRISGAIQSEIVTAERRPPAAPAAGPGERRCGWLTNPTPGNWWLFDGHGEWILSTQGGEQAPGFDDMPDMTTAGWVETNGHYGYGCACMTIAYDPTTRRVTRMANAKPKPLKQCRDDRGLPRP